jgi:hypothetical protein
MSLRKDVEFAKKVTSEVEAWLADYEMPVTAYGVISALMSLGYLSSKLTKRAADGLDREGDKLPSSPLESRDS